ncbi:MAG TPA: patatin-like phospholipase family protein [Vicinamibacterales bacterium]|nr:patatin-like phospholipase family protein [Vicinamibacterales bacterium]
MARDAGRPTVGVAFGGGSARGIAHVGVIRWFEEHRIPIDLAAGTSMGGLVGGAFASGMDARELQGFIAALNWDELFGSSRFAYKNIRRKADGRAYPSRLEFGLRGGIVPPSALNDGESVELMLGRIAGPYFDVDSFDDLPTPFRTVAVDLLTAQPVVMRTGSLADAMRATMSLPLIFPPVAVDGQLLIDGGTMNNVPADVVKAMGADRVVAVNVGDLSNPERVSYTMFGIAGTTIDAMMRASTLRVLTSADVVVNVPLREYGSLDWRRSADLIEEGYRAAEAMRASLLPLALDEAQFEAWQRARQARRRTELPAPVFLELDGFGANDASRLTPLMERHIGVPLDVAGIERDIAIVSGLDRYETVTWRLTHDAARGYGLRLRGQLKAYAPPFMMLGVNLENTTSSDFRITASARYLGFDMPLSGSELRVDGTVGSNPSIGIELYQPLGPTPLFIAPYAGVGTQTLNFVENDAIAARYSQVRSRIGLNAGLNLGAFSDLRVGAYLGRASATIEIGNPGLPEVSGKETGAEIVWRMDTQDSPVVPSRGLLSQVRLVRIFNGPDLAIGGQSIDTPDSLTQLSGTANRFWSVTPRGRVFVAGGLGATLAGTPLPTAQFEVGGPFRLGTYSPGEIRGDHFYAASGGYLRQIGRLPDFMGGPVFVGGWLENADAFDDWSLARWRTNGGAGIVMDTLIGPVLLAGSWSFDGRWRTYLGVGRIFR